jgi:porphobilinogen synthase
MLFQRPGNSDRRRLMGFPQIRMRRLRKNAATRRLVRETTLSVDNLIYPLFVCEGFGIKKPIISMTNCFHFSSDMLAAEIEELANLKIPAVILFGLPNKKDEVASQAYAADGVAQRAIKAIKKINPDILVITDVCLCEYTSHGHCGVIKDGKVDNDTSLQLLAKTALSHAQAGADMVAPSDMMDGRVAAIRKTLEHNGFADTAIMAYSAKYASAFYDPFRDAAESTPSFGDRKAYQMDPANWREAMREIELDIEEGTDIVMVKPALPYLDIICRAKQRFDVPIAAYHVSGEYMMLDAAAKANVLDRQAAMLEVHHAIKRAGADIIITYNAKNIAAFL